MTDSLWGDEEPHPISSSPFSLMHESVTLQQRTLECRCRPKFRCGGGGGAPAPARLGIGVSAGRRGGALSGTCPARYWSVCRTAQRCTHRHLALVWCMTCTLFIVHAARDSRPNEELTAVTPVGVRPPPVPPLMRTNILPRGVTVLTRAMLEGRGRGRGGGETPSPHCILEYLNLKQIVTPCMTPSFRHQFCTC